MDRILWQAIHRAARDGDADALRRALETNVSPDVENADGFVPLHYVVAYTIRHRDVDGDDTDNRVACINLLAAAGANILKVRAAGSFRQYEHAHLNALAASFAPKFSHLLPPELVRRVVEYAFHVGDY